MNIEVRQPFTVQLCGLPGFLVDHRPGAVRFLFQVVSLSFHKEKLKRRVERLVEISAIGRMPKQEVTGGRRAVLPQNPVCHQPFRRAGPRVVGAHAKIGKGRGNRFPRFSVKDANEHGVLCSVHARDDA